MAKKSATKEAKPKGEPSKPPKLRKGKATGGGGGNAKPVNEDVMDSAGENNSAMPVQLEGWNPFRESGLKGGTLDIIDRIQYLKFLATNEFLKSQPELQSTREKASGLLADLTALFIHHWPSDPRCVQPEIWRLHEDLAGGFRVRWDARGKEPGKKRAGMPVVPMVDDFAVALLCRAYTTNLSVRPDNLNELWRDHLELEGRKSWPSFWEMNLRHYHNVDGERERGGKTTIELGWTKGRWRDKVRRALFKRVRDAALA